METSELKIVFDHLFNILSPTVKKIKKDFEYTNYPKKRMWTTPIADCNFSNITNMPNIDSYIIEITENNILIVGDNLEYNIKPDQIIRVYNKIIKTF